MLAGEAFGLEGGDEALGEGVVVGMARAAQAAGDAPGGGQLREGLGGVLHAAVAVVEPGRAAAAGAARRAEGGGGQLGAQVLAAVVGHAAARAGIKGEGKIEPAFASFDGGKIALPHHAGTFGRGHLGEPVLRDPVRGAAVGGHRAEAALLGGPQGAARA